MPRRWGLGGPGEREAIPEPARPVRLPTGPRPGPVEVVVEVPVPPSEAIGWFLDPDRWVRFQGRAARLDPRPGGEIRIELGDGVLVVGRYMEVEPTRVSFTWGRPGDPSMPSEGSLVTVAAVPLSTGGAELLLRHEGLVDAGVADAHRSGWRYHLVRLSVAAGGATGETERVELFLAAAGEADALARRGLLERTCAAGIEVADHVGRVVGIGPLGDHLGRGALAAANRRFVRTGAVERVGALLRCRYAVVERRTTGAATIEDGEVVAALDAGGKFTALSLF